LALTHYIDDRTGHTQWANARTRIDGERQRQIAARVPQALARAREARRVAHIRAVLARKTPVEGRKRNSPSDRRYVPVWDNMSAFKPDIEPASPNDRARPTAVMCGQFCCAAQRPSRCGRLKVPLAPGGLRETARHSKPETRETAAPQADEAEAQQLANSHPPSQCNCCRSANASHCTDPRTGAGAGAADGDH